MTDEQKEDMNPIIDGIKNSGSLDYVAAWYIKAADYIQHTKIKVGLVSTNSIVQGDQAIILWQYLFNTKRITIHFAHQTFKWTNEAKGKAAVYCIIIGFSNHNGLSKNLYSYPDISGDPTLSKVNNINQYLLDAPSIFIQKRSNPISDVSPMLKGSSPTDGKNYLFTEIEMLEFILKEPGSSAYFRPYIGSTELINNIKRYCLYLADCPPTELRKMPLVLERVEAVRAMRLASKKEATRQWADAPLKFAEDRITNGSILVIPRVSSENRKYIPIGFFEPPTVCSDAAFQVVNASLYLFGILNSSMHMAWVRTVAGRLKSDYRYSNTIVYNNFVFPEPSYKEIQAIEMQAKKILSVRENYKSSTLADLYDPFAMPFDLLKAHQQLDKLVEKSYGKSFKLDEDRVAHLFELYTKKSK